MSKVSRVPEISIMLKASEVRKRKEVTQVLNLLNLFKSLNSLT